MPLRENNTSDQNSDWLPEPESFCGSKKANISENVVLLSILSPELFTGL